MHQAQVNSPPQIQNNPHHTDKKREVLELADTLPHFKSVYNIIVYLHI